MGPMVDEISDSMKRQEKVPTEAEIFEHLRVQTWRNNRRGVEVLFS